MAAASQSFAVAAADVSVSDDFARIGFLTAQALLPIFAFSDFFRRE
jgi:hypothetical protein